MQNKVKKKETIISVLKKKIKYYKAAGIVSKIKWITMEIGCAK